MSERRRSKRFAERAGGGSEGEQGEVEPVDEFRDESDGMDDIFEIIAERDDETLKGLLTKRLRKKDEESTEEGEAKTAQDGQDQRAEKDDKKREKEKKNKTAPKRARMASSKGSASSGATTKAKGDDTKEPRSKGQGSGDSYEHNARLLSAMEPLFKKAPTFSDEVDD